MPTLILAKIPMPASKSVLGPRRCDIFMFRKDAEAYKLRIVVRLIFDFRWLVKLVASLYSPENNGVQYLEQEKHRFGNYFLPAKKLSDQYHR